MSVVDQLKRWLPMFGAGWLAMKVLLAQLAVRIIEFHNALGHTDRAQTIERLAPALGIDIHVANSMATGAALLVICGLVAKCTKLYRYWRAGKIRFLAESGVIEMTPQLLEHLEKMAPSRSPGVAKMTAQKLPPKTGA